MPYASVFAPACAAAIHRVGRVDGYVCDSPASLRGAVTPRCAGSQIEAEHAPDPECGAGEPIDPWRDCVDTRKLDQTAPTDRPAYTSPRTSGETTKSILGGGRALDFFSQGLRQHVLVEREVGHQPFEAGVFLFQLPQSAEFTHAEKGIRLFARVGGLFGSPELPTDLPDRSPALGLPHGIDDLLFREL